MVDTRAGNAQEKHIKNCLAHAELNIGYSSVTPKECSNILSAKQKNESFKKFIEEMNGNANTRLKN